MSYTGIAFFRRKSTGNSLQILLRFLATNTASTLNKEVLSERSQKFLGSRPVEFTNTLSIETPKRPAIPIYKVMDSTNEQSTVVNATSGDIERWTQMFKFMLKVRVLDQILLNAQRQGRISFYHTCTGEEGVLAGTVAGLSFEDLIFAQYREFPGMLYRGMPLQSLMDQMLNNEGDLGKGRQFPCNFGLSTINFVTISAPLSTQMPHSVGAAYSLKLRSKQQIVLCYFGDGGSSEGDAHAAFNFAATLNCPVLFLCRNNGYAISTPCTEQYAGDGVAGRAEGYGMAAIRVDGNDPLAVLQATAAARDYILRHGKPVILEAMTYRVGDHSTSDDSRRYRPAEEASVWQNDDPLERLKSFLLRNNMILESMVSDVTSDLKKECLEALAIAEKKRRPDPSTMFEDVYDVMPDHLQKQQTEMKAFQRLKRN